MTKKSFFLRNVVAAATCLAGMTMFASCEKTTAPDNNSGNASTNASTSDVGVIINGVKWATRNVDAVGTFAPTPESFGKFYQWNRKVAWAATGEITGWDDSFPEGTKSNDPSPAGWRVPTSAEQQTLLNTTYVSTEWTTCNGVNGRLFTDKATGNTLFLPAAGYRDSDGTLDFAGTYGYYWSSTQGSSTVAQKLGFSSDNAGWHGNSDRRGGFSVRCVQE